MIRFQTDALPNFAKLGVKQSRIEVQRNLEAQGVKKNLEQLSELILTFYYGLSTRSGLEPAQKLENQIEDFIETLRKTTPINKPRRKNS